MANVDPSGFSAAVLHELGIPVTDLAVQALNAMQQGEGQWGAGGSWNARSDFNPFNISGGQSVANQYNLGVSANKTQNPGNGPPVDEFAGWSAGVTATANFLKNADPGMYSALEALGRPNAGQPEVQAFFNAAQNSGSFGASAGSRIQFMGQPVGSTLPIAGQPGAVTSGTQTNVPGIGNAANATSSPSAITPGAQTTSSIQYPQGQNAAAIPQLSTNATWPQTEAYIRKNYPTYSWLLNIKGPDSPASVIQQAVEGGWDSTRLQAGIAQTKWWKDTSTSVQQWQQNTATHPGEYDFNVKGSTAQQTLGTIIDAAKSAGFKPTDAEAKNLATEAMMYGWNPTQIRQNVGTVAATGTAQQQFSTSYLSGMESNPGQYAIGGQGKPTGPIAASAITQVRNAIAGQGYNPKDFPEEDVQNLATEYMKFGWTSQQLAQAVIKVGAGGTAYQLDPTYTQGLVTNPQQYEINGMNGTGTVAAKALTTVRDAIAGAGKTIGGKGGITAQQVQELAQESMMFGWNAQQLAQNINSLGKGGGLLSPSYLQGLITNAQEYQPGGQAYVQAQSAVKTAVAGAGKTLSPQAMNALTEAYMEQGWQNDPDKLVQAIGTAGGGAGYTSQYLTGAQANPEQYQPGGTAYIQATNDVMGALRNNSVDPSQITQDEMITLVEGVMQQGWDPTTLSNEIGALTQKGTPDNQQYLTGVAANPLEYQFTNPSKNKGVQTTADQVLTQVEIVAGLQGVNLRPAQAQQVALEAMKSGGNNPSDAIIQSMLDKFVYVGANPAQPPQQPISVNAATSPAGQGAPLASTTPPNSGLGAQTNAPALLQQLRTQATNYLISPPDNVLQQWAQQIAGGTQTMQSFEAYLAQQAGEKYPGMQQQIQQGQTPTQVAGGLTTLASQLLEIQPDQVNYLNPQFGKMLTGGYDEQGSGPNATKLPNNMMMTQTQAGDYLRGLPQFQYTMGAKNDAASLSTAILQDFGRVA